MSIAIRYRQACRPSSETTLEVGEHAQDGVDLAGVGQLLELLDGQHAGGTLHGGPPFGLGMQSKNQR
jgi:hypothetical protein